MKYYLLYLHLRVKQKRTPVILPARRKKFRLIHKIKFEVHNGKIHIAKHMKRKTLILSSFLTATGVLTFLSLVFHLPLLILLPENIPEPLGATQKPLVAPSKPHETPSVLCLSLGCRRGWRRGTE